MNFDLTEEQALLADSLARYLGQSHDQRAAWQDGPSPRRWRDFAELGWLGASLPEALGGSGGGAVETMVIMEAFGRALVVEPYVATVLLGAGTILRAGDAGRAERLIQRVTGGGLQLAVAAVEPQARFDLNDVATTAERRGGGWVLSGAKAPALNAPDADLILVSARTGGARRDCDGISLFLVPRDAAGLRLRGFRTQDGLVAGDLRLDEVALDGDALLGPAGQGLDALESVENDAALAVCAMAVGAAEAAVAATAEYLRVRQQFGRPLASFQALQHRVVDMHVLVEELRSLVLAATATAESDDGAARRRAVSAAKIQLGTTARLVGQEAVQMHGGIGMTEEYAIGRYCKRLLACATLFGDADHHLGRYDVAAAVG